MEIYALAAFANEQIIAAAPSGWRLFMIHVD